MSAYLAPEIKLRAFRPLDTAAIDVPLDLISEITSTRSLAGGGISLRLHGQRKLGLRNENIKRLRELLPDQTVVSLSVRRRPGESFRQINMGLVRTLKQEIAASGQINWTPSIVSLDQKLADQKLYIDVQDSTQTPGEKKRTGNAVTEAVIGLREVVREMKTAPRLATAVWDSLIFKLLNKNEVAGRPVAFGGRPLIGTAGSEGSLLDFRVFNGPGYAEGFLHILHIVNSIRFGESVNFYQLLASLVTPPLYELFFDPLEGEGEISEGEAYKVKVDQSLLIYRKTPFETLFDDAGFYRTDRKAPEIKAASSISVETVPEDLYTGVHVAPGILETTAAALQSPATFNDLLRVIHGYNVMEIRLSGVGFPLESGSESRPALNAALERIQSMIFRNFCGGVDGQSAPLRNTVGRVAATFDFYRVGSVYALPDVLGRRGPDANREFWNDWKGKRLPDRLEDFGGFGYVTGVTDTFSIGSRRATSAIQLKWIDRIQ